MGAETLCRVRPLKIQAKQARTVCNVYRILLMKYTINSHHATPYGSPTKIY